MTRMGRETTATSWLLVTAMALIMGPSLVTASKVPSQLPSRAPGKLQAMESYGKLPLSFEANDGQTDSQVKFLARGRGYTLSLAQNEAVFVLRKAKGENTSRGTFHASRDYQETVLRMRLEGANPTPRAAGLEKLPGVVNYFIGNDPKKWHANIPTYQKVEYKNIYSGIDLVYYGNQRQLEYDFVVSPGADPNQITLAFEGAENPRLADNGDLTLTVSGVDLYLQKPLVYQQDEKGRKQLVAGRYILLATESSHVGFQVASYDRARPLIIDPVLAYSTYLGGTGVDIGRAIAVDANGNAYVTGRTASPDFPTQGAFQGGLASSQDAFVTKLNAAGSALVYSTYLGGSGRDDQGNAIAVDAAGNAYVTGFTFSTTFPTTTGAFDATCGTATLSCNSERGDAFVTKLNAAGSALVYSTYLGGGGDDQGNAIVVDTTLSAYVTGSTRSNDFPTTPDAFREVDLNSTDVFVTKLNAAGSALVYSTYLGGFSIDEGNGIAVDADGNAYVTGLTSSSTEVPFPTTSGAIQPTFGGGVQDAFVTKLNPAGGGVADLIYSTYLGGSGLDQGRGIAVDAAGNAYVTGITDSDDYPTLGAFQDMLAGLQDAFVTKLNAAGSALIYSTFLGGDNFDNGLGIVVDTAGSAFVTGLTFSENFPTTPDAFDATCGTGVPPCSDAFVTNLDAAGSALIYSTYVGGEGSEQGNAIAVHTTGSVYVTGFTESATFPIKGTLQSTQGGGADAFVTKLSPPNTPTGGNVTVQDGPVTATFANVTAAGDTTFTQSAGGPAPPAGFKLGNPPTYYDITTTATFTGAVTVCIDYTGIAFGNEASLKLFHSEDPKWVNATTSLDTVNDLICGTVTSLSPFAILEAADQAFATFRPEVEIKLPRGVNNDTFEVEAFFRLSTASDGVFPLTEALTLEVGSYSTTIPAGSFKEKKGRFKFKGVIDGVRLAVKIRPARKGGFKFEAEGKCADLTGTVNPVTVELTIGDDRGSANVRAEISSRHEGRKCGESRDGDKDDEHDRDDDDD